MLDEIFQNQIFCSILHLYFYVSDCSRNQCETETKIGLLISLEFFFL